MSFLNWLALPVMVWREVETEVLLDCWEVMNWEMVLKFYLILS